MGCDIAQTALYRVLKVFNLVAWGLDTLLNLESRRLATQWIRRFEGFGVLLI